MDQIGMDVGSKKRQKCPLKLFASLLLFYFVFVVVVVTFAKSASRINELTVEHEMEGYSGTFHLKPNK